MVGLAALHKEGEGDVAGVLRVLREYAALLGRPALLQDTVVTPQPRSLRL